MDFALGTFFLHSWADPMSTSELLVNRMLQLNQKQITVQRVREVLDVQRVKSSLDFNMRMLTSCEQINSKKEIGFYCGIRQWIRNGVGNWMIAI
ncbi:hypothetical protein CcCBS67573_g09555 [Chytriomyces confervae]|uniref:Uncharacterized protein n=1 Tax=Chytriomyces confervae TaxID=246404 RepID=A0A507DSA8_9FUNG|nr:hypothetical protein CcCBS67573_g09555 [Chytriomyces confervae]